MSALTIPPSGCEACVVLSTRQLVLRYGSTLALISKGSAAIRTEFESEDPTADWAKWEARCSPESSPGTARRFALFYLLVENPAAEPIAVLRCVLDGFSGSGSGPPRGVGGGAAAPLAPPPLRSRMVVDFVLTMPKARGQGLASMLLEVASQTARAHAANVLVLATEDSCAWWMQKGFLLEASPALNARLNVFSDTHLLRHVSNVADEGDPADIARFADEAEDDHEEEEDDEEEEEGEEEAEDMDLQRALLASSSSSAAGSAAAAAVATSGGAASSSSDSSCSADSTSSLGKRTRSDEEPDRWEDDDPELAAAIALSLEAIG